MMQDIVSYSISFHRSVSSPPIGPSPLPKLSTRRLEDLIRYIVFPDPDEPLCQLAQPPRPNTLHTGLERKNSSCSFTLDTKSQRHDQLCCGMVL